MLIIAFQQRQLHYKSHCMLVPCALVLFEMSYIFHNNYFAYPSHDTNTEFASNILRFLHNAYQLWVVTEVNYLQPRLFYFNFLIYIFLLFISAVGSLRDYSAWRCLFKAYLGSIGLPDYRLCPTLLMSFITVLCTISSYSVTERESWQVA